MSDFQVSPELLEHLPGGRAQPPRGPRPLPARPWSARLRRRGGGRRAGPAAHPEGQQRDDGLHRHQGLRPPAGGRVRARRAKAALALLAGPVRPPLRRGQRPARRGGAGRRATDARRATCSERDGAGRAARGRAAERRRAARERARALAPSAPDAAPAARPPCRRPRRRAAAARSGYVGQRAPTWCAWTSRQLDHLLNLVGELIIYRTKLHQLGEGPGGAARASGTRAASCSAAVHQVARRQHAAPGDGDGHPHAAHPPRLRALPAPGARPGARSRARRSS